MIKILICLALMILTILAQPLITSCGSCKKLNNCSSNICKKYEGAGFKNFQQECLADTSSCPSNQNVRYPQFCHQDTQHNNCNSGCCLKQLPVSTAKTVCTDNMFKQQMYCTKVFKNEVIALIIVVSLVSVCLMAIIVGFCISKCCKTKQDLQRQEYIEYKKTLQTQNKPKFDTELSKKKGQNIPNDSTFKAGNQSNNNSIGVVSKNSISIIDEMGRQVILQSSQGLSRADI